MPETDITHRLPPVIAAYIKASNEADADAYLGTLSDGAIVNDIQREFRGKAAIGKWAEREIFGTYDKTGLPDPLILTFYFTVRDDKITMLIILHNKPAETL
jgi:hypothetical protein